MSSLPPENPPSDAPAQPESEQPGTAHTPPTAEQPKRLTRSGDDRVIGGVAGGLARHLNVDPLLVRIALVVLAIGFPPTIVGYLAALVFVPEDGKPSRPADSRNRVIAAVLVGALLLVMLPVLVPFGLLAGPPVLGVLVPLLLLAGIVWLVVRVLGAEGGTTGRRLAAAVGMVMLAVTGFLAALTAAVFGAGWVVAAVVVVCGVALIAAAFAGGARWLLAPALLLALPLAGVAAADVKLDGGVGEREYRPASIADVREKYDLGAGQLTVDLRDVDFPDGDTRVKIELGMGEARLLVPAEVCVAPDIHIGAGEARVGGRQQNGIDVDWNERPAADGMARLIVDADIGLGEIRVDSSGRGGDRFDDLDGSGHACA
jgi:phage shock protein PspC (stress-responsive transcriptional regulator)/predicted membrane protein